MEKRVTLYKKCYSSVKWYYGKYGRYMVNGIFLFFFTGFFYSEHKTQQISDLCCHMRVDQQRMTKKCILCIFIRLIVQCTKQKMR